MSDRYAIVHPDEVPAEEFITSSTTVHKLTEPLGCRRVRINRVIIEPGEVTEPHTHPGQEEVFVAWTDAQIEISDELHAVEAGSVVRVREDVVRNLVNRTDTERHVWLAFGAPPVGSIDDFGAFELATE